MRARLVSFVYVSSRSLALFLPSLPSLPPFLPLTHTRTHAHTPVCVHPLFPYVPSLPTVFLSPPSRSGAWWQLMCVCVCVCACVRARARVRMRACVRCVRVCCLCACVPARAPACIQIRCGNDDHPVGVRIGARLSRKLGLLSNLSLSLIFSPGQLFSCGCSASRIHAYSVFVRSLVRVFLTFHFSLCFPLFLSYQGPSAIIHRRRRRRDRHHFRPGTSRLSFWRSASSVRLLCMSGHS